MGKLIQFPNIFDEKQEANPYSGELRPLLGIPALEIYERVFEVNFEFLGLEFSDKIAEYMHFYTDNRFPCKILVDITDCEGHPPVRGLYSVDLNTYKLIKISDSPLVHFTSLKC